MTPLHQAVVDALEAGSCRGDAVATINETIALMSEEVLLERDKIHVRRQRLAPGEATPWHRDPHHRVTVVLSGEALVIEYPDGTSGERFSVRAGQVDWDEPTERVHRGVNVGEVLYEEVAVFFLDDPGAHPQPRAGEDEER